MNTNVLNINDLLANMDQPLARGVIAIVAVVALLLVLAKVRTMIANAAYRNRRAPRVSRAVAKQLAKEGIKPVIRKENQYYRSTAHRRYEYR